jgi:hypothetical protein
VRLAELSGRSVAVWGTGPEGRAALRAIAGHAPARLLAVDDSAGYQAVPWTDEPASLAGGDHAFPALATAEVVVCGPEVPAAHPWLAELAERRVNVTTGAALWLADHAPHTIAVTGGDSRAAAGLLTQLLIALGRTAAHGGSAEVPLLGLPAADEYVAELSPQDCAALTRAPRVVAVTGLAGVQVLRHRPELIVVDGTDLALRDAVRGTTDLNGFPPIPAAADDSRFRIEDDQVFCSDEPLFPRGALRLAGDRDGRALCVALAVLDGLGIDVPGSRDDLRTAVTAFEPHDAASTPAASKPAASTPAASNPTASK